MDPDSQLQAINALIDAVTQKIAVIDTEISRAQVFQANFRRAAQLQSRSVSTMSP